MHRNLHKTIIGMGKGVISGGGSDNRDAYLQLSVTILAAFGCVPEIASSEYMILKIPLVLEIMSKESRSHVLEECYEFLYLVSSSSEDGAATLYESDGMKVLASQMPTFPDGSRIMEFAMRLVQLIVNKLSLATISNGYLSELTMMVATIVRQFAVLHNALKFEALHLLSMIFSQCPIQTFTVRIKVFMLCAGWKTAIGNIYLAETPIACKEKVMELLVYMLFIEGEDEPSPFYSVCFLLPMLCQITMEIEGCKALASSGGYKAVVECLIKLIGPTQIMVADNSCIFMACDTMMNLLLKKEQVRLSMDESTSADLLKALGYWAGNTDDLSIIMMASSLCALILDFTSEAALLNQSSFGHTSLRILSQLFVRSLAHGQESSDDAKAEMDLLEIVASGYSRWTDRYPSITDAVERSWIK
ncbi:neurochondrin [Tripterygium wilfordii]|uniref:Neurochondrin n=1 Tax=Tripterygium wilfordii TaxID=458696 RepID=A0A7J7BWI2_TRIWF|nr:neurochondrin [Tripterygium wilfordii]